jgi:O-antigen/teichoic acid export membrane protein
MVINWIKKYKMIISSLLTTDSKELWKHMSNYFSAALFTKFLAFISLPIFTRLLGPDGYGGFALFLSITSIMGIVATFGVDTGIRRYCFERTYDEKKFLSSNLVFLIACQVGILVFVVIFASELVSIISIPFQVIIMGVLIGILYSYKNILHAFWQAKGKSSKIRNFSVASGVLVLIFSSVFVLILGNYFGNVYGTLLSSIIMSIYLFSQTKSLIIPKYDFGLVKYSLFVGIPIVFNQIAGYVLVFFDRLVINKYYGLHDTGLYSFAYNIGMLMDIVIYAINAAWVPILFKKLNDNKMMEVNSYFIQFTKLVSLGAIILIMFSREIITLLADNRFHESLTIVPVIIIGYVFKYLYSAYSHIEYYHKKTHMLALFSIIAGIINIILNLVFVPNFGPVSAAYTTVASYVVLFILHYLYVRYGLKDNTLNVNSIVKPLLYLSLIILIFIMGQSLFIGWIKLTVFKIVLVVLSLLLLFFNDNRNKINI